MAQDVSTQIAMSSLDRDGKTAILRLSTTKASSGGIVSMASVVFMERGLVTFELCGDYNERICVDRTARATQKALENQHAQAFPPARVEDIKQSVIRFYEDKAAKAARN